MEIKTEKQLQGFFWDIMYPRYAPQRGYKQNDYCADVRVAWVDFVDTMHKDKRISDELAFEATL